MPSHVAEALQFHMKEKRTRRKAPKTRRGCSRCKTRRIKCDEQIPSCRNCVRNGALCPGYQRELRWSQKHERLAKASADTDSAQLPTDDGALAALQTSFVSRTSRERSGNLMNNGADKTSYGSFDFPAVEGEPFRDCAFSSSGGVIANNAQYENTKICGGMFPTQPQHFAAFQSPLRMFDTPEHLPTELVRHWFSYICPMMSTFDSEINYNRRIAESSWSMSKPVFYTIQAMAAACLVDSQPHMRPMLWSLRLQAVTAVNQGIVYARKSKGAGITADLVFAIFALGLSSSWSNSQLAMSETAWLDVAREILEIWEAELSALDFLFHSYFCQALSYWEMLEVVAGDGSISSKGTRSKLRYQPKFHRALGSTEGFSDDPIVHGPWTQDSGQSLLGTRPNSWCGISNEVIDMLGQVVNLCRIARNHVTDSTALTLGDGRRSLCDIYSAQSLQQELISMDFPAFISTEETRGFPVLTRDDKTPISHLLQTAEAYRIAALLQLHLTFSDLPIVAWERPCVGGSPNSSQSPTSFVANERMVSCMGLLQRMAIDLINILDHIPGQSGSTSIHPVLYLSAAAGLRLEPHPSTTQLSSHDELHIYPKNQESTNSLHADGGHLIKLSRLDSALDNHTATLALNSDVSRARVVTRRRLNALERPLAQKARDNMLRAVDTIWHEYDSSPPASAVHWLDITMKHGLSITLW